MAKRYIPEGSWLACDKGTCPSSFRISHNNNTNIYGSKLASEADLMPFFNIKPMGICTVRFGSCIPAVPKWDNPQDGVTVNGYRLLKEDSTCQCLLGGTIKIYFDRAAAAAACVAGEIKMPSEYIKEGFDWVAEQNAQSREARDSVLPGWMHGVAHVSDWFNDAGTGLVEGAVNGVVGMGEGLYQISQDPVGTAEAVGGMVSSGYNSAKEGLTHAYDWASSSDNWSNAYQATTNWVSSSDNWKAAAGSAWESTKEAGSWVANNPRTIGTSVGQFIPDVAAAVYTGGASGAASAARIAAKEAEEAAVRQLEKQAVERLAKEEAARLAAKELARGAEEVAGEVVVKSEKELAEEAAEAAKSKPPIIPKWKGPADYSGIDPSKYKIGAGRDFSPAQKKAIYEANRAHNDGLLRSDLDGSVLQPSAKSMSGVKDPPINEAQVDHINPKAKGGGNRFDNAQVLSRKQNRDKWHK